MKKLASIFIAGILLFTSFSCFAEAEYAEVTINGKLIDFTDANGNEVKAQVINDRTMVPMRKIFEELGATVEWIEDFETIFVAKDDKLIAMQIGASSMTSTNVTSGETINIILDVPPMLVDDRTLVPVRAISEVLDMNVDWNDESHTVIITNK